MCKTKMEYIDDSLDAVFEEATGNHKWGVMHVRTFQAPVRKEARALVHLITGLALYADAHEGTYESGIGEDAVLGECWEEIAQGIRGLLNGVTGGLDVGTLDKLLSRMLNSEGFEP
jgi:hypothetical protein